MTKTLPGTVRRTPQKKREIVPEMALLLVLFIQFFIVAGRSEAAASPHIRLIVTATAQEAEEVLAAVRSGKAFALLAKERSIDKSRERYGELDSADRRSLAGPLNAAVSLMREGDISRVIRIDNDHYALIQSIDLRNYRSGAAAFRAGDFKSAESHLLRHMDENPDAIKARLMLGEIYERQGLVEKALGIYNDALTHEPGNTDAETRKNTLSRAKKVPNLAALPKTVPPETTDTQEQGKEGSPRSLPGRGETALAGAVPLRMIIAGSEKKAKDIVAELHRGKPFFFLAHDNSADKKSAEEYGDLGVVDPLTLHPSIQDVLSTLQPGQTSGIIRLGEGSYAIIQVKDTGHFADAEKAFSAGNHQDAEQHLLQHLRLNPEDAEAWIMLASLYEMRRDSAGAEDAYYQAMVFNPRAPGPYERLGKIYLERRDYARARDLFGTGLRMTSSRRLFEKLMEIANISLIGTVR